MLLNIALIIFFNLKVLVPPNNHMSNHQNLFAIQLNAVSVSTLIIEI